MGCCKRGLGATASVNVAAPALVVWETIANVEGSVDYLPVVTSVKREEPNGWKVGTKWQEIRTYEGDDVIMHKTVTSLVEDRHKQSYSVAIAVTFTKNDNGDWNDGANTSSLAVTSSSPSDCVLMGTYYAIPGPNSWISRIRWLVERPFLQRYSASLFREELQHIATEAEKRCGLQKVNNS